MSLHIWYVSKLPYLGIVQLFTESIYALSSKSFSCPQIAFTCLYGRAFYTGLGTCILYWAWYIRTEGPIFVSGGSGVDLLQLLLFLPDRSPALATLWSFCASATLSFLLTICSSFFILIQHCSVCLWRSKCTMEKWLSWHAYYVNVFLIPKSNIP